MTDRRRNVSKLDCLVTIVNKLTRTRSTLYELTLFDPGDRWHGRASREPLQWRRLRRPVHSPPALRSVDSKGTVVGNLSADPGGGNVTRLKINVVHGQCLPTDTEISTEPAELRNQ